MPYNASASGGSNLGALNPVLVDAVKGRIEALKAADPDNQSPIPADLVNASGSGLDPISARKRQPTKWRALPGNGICQSPISRRCSANTPKAVNGVFWRAPGQCARTQYCS